MKSERKKAVKRTLEERMEIQKQKLHSMENTKVYRDIVGTLRNKDLTISERVDKVKAMFTPEEKEVLETPVNE